MKNYLLCYQTPYDSVKYITNELASPTFLSYYKFIDYIQTIFVHNYYEFEKELNKFKNILIDLDNHTWEIYKESEKEKPSRKEMFEYHEKLEKEKEDKSRKKIEMKKNFIKNKVNSLGNEFNYKVRGE